VNIKILIFFGAAILGTAFALLATYPDYRRLTDTISNIGAIVSLVLAIYAFWRER